MGAFLLLWEAGALAAGSDLIFPGPLPALRQLAALCRTPRFFAFLGSSFCRVLGGMLLAAPAGFICGVAAGLSTRAASFARPFFAVISATPVMAVILIAFLVFGAGGTPVFTSFLMVFPVMAANAQEGLRSVSPELKEVFRVYRISPRDTLRYLYLPSIAPFVLGGLRSSLALCWKVVAAAEVLVQPLRGLGTGMQQAKANLETPELFAWTIATVLAAALSERLLFLALSPRKKTKNAQTA